MNTIDLNKIGLLPIEDLEMKEITGGNWGWWLKRITWFGIGKEVIDHWDEIKNGLQKGWNFNK